MKYLVAAYLATWGFIPWILLARKRPVSTLAWIWAVVLFPFAGPLGYLLFGVDRITRPRREQQAEADETLPDTTQRAPPLLERDAPLFRTIAKLSDFESSSADELCLLAGAEAFYDALRRGIEAATHHVHLEFFVWEQDRCGRRILESAVMAAMRGVAVRVLLDRLGSLHTGRRFFQPLIDAGGHVEWFRSLNPLRRRFALHLRNHRKLQIIDGRIAFVGGMNLGVCYTGADPSIGLWRDCQLQLRGPIVAQLQRCFAEDWYFAAEREFRGPEYFPSAEPNPARFPAQIAIGGPDLTPDAMADQLVALLHHARRRAWFSTGYFVPGDIELSAFRLAAARGVDLRLLGSQSSDHPYLAEIGRSYYEALLLAGVRIYEFVPGLHHAKALLVDDDLCMIGSANCDHRSLRLNFELNVLAQSGEAAGALEQFFLHSFADSHEITLREFRRRPLHRKLLEVILRPLAPMI